MWVAMVSGLVKLQRCGAVELSAVKHDPIARDYDQAPLWGGVFGGGLMLNALPGRAAPQTSATTLDRSRPAPSTQYGTKGARYSLGSGSLSLPKPSRIVPEPHGFPKDLERCFSALQSRKFHLQSDDYKSGALPGELAGVTRPPRILGGNGCGGSKSPDGTTARRELSAGQRRCGDRQP